MNIKFWKDNRLDKGFTKTVNEVISDFIKSGRYEDYQKGMPFERCILAFMVETYGTFDKLSDEEWHMLDKVRKNMEKSPKKD